MRVVVRPQTKTDKATAKAEARRTRRSGNDLKAVDRTKASDIRLDAEAFLQRIESFCRQAATLSDEIEDLRWLDLLGNSFSVDDGIDFYQEVRRFEVYLITQALKAMGGSQRKSAALLGMNTTTLNNKIKIYQIKCEAVTVCANTAEQPSTDYTV